MSGNLAWEVKHIKKEKKNITFNIVFGISNLVAVTLFYKNIILTAIVLGFLTISLILFYKSHRTLVPVFVFCMVFGALAEIYAVHGGVWAYASTDFLSIPLWLFVLWGNAGLFIYRSAVELERLGFHD